MGNRTYDVAAADIGGTGGKIAAISFDGNEIKLKKEHNFANREVYAGGALYWDVLSIYADINEGFHALKQDGEIRSLGIDTWGVDFGLLDNQERLMGNVYHMRDFRTKGIPEEIFEIIPERELFYETASDSSRFYGLYQLYSLKKTSPYILENARYLMFTPDLLNFFFTGEIGKSDITMAGTSQLLDGSMTDWGYDVFRRIGLPHNYLNTLGYPGEITGKTTDGTEVVRIAGHDTVPAVSCIREDAFYISGGTYLVTGFRSPETIRNDAMIRYGFKNTTGPDHDFLVYRNVTGFWTLKEVMDEYALKGEVYDYGEMIEMALREEPFASVVNIDMFADKRPSMVRSIQEYCRQHGQAVPDTAGKMARTLYESYAMQVRRCFCAAREISGRSHDAIYVVNGACKNKLLCQMIADAAGVRVFAGMPRATIMGNAGIQLIAGGEIGDYAQLCEVAEQSVPYDVYEPENTKAWDEQYEKLEELLTEV